MSYYVKTLHFVFDVSCSGSMSASHCGKYCRWGGVGAWLNCKVIAQLCLSMRKGNTDNRMSAHPVCISLLHWLFFLHAQTELCYNLTVSSRCSLRQRAEIKPRSLSFFFFYSQNHDLTTTRIFRNFLKARFRPRTSLPCVSVERALCSVLASQYSVPYWSKKYVMR